MNWKVEKLLKGEDFITSEKGNSMTPKIKSGQEHRLEPVDLNRLEVGDIVFCKVKGKYYTHLIKAINPDKGFLIGNNKGGINGWTKLIYGKVTEIL